MPKLATPLTEKQIESVAPRARSFIIGDGGGLYLQIEPSGKKVWRMAYRRDHRETSISFGPYPDVSLTEARHCRDNARQLIAEGVDPVERRREKGKQERPGIAARPKLRMSMSGSGDLTIEKSTGRLVLNPAQVAALRSFLNATTDETVGASTCQS
jgi:hypothetical protein